MKRIIRIGMDVHSTNYTLCAMEPIIGEDDRIFATIDVAPNYKNILMFIVFDNWRIVYSWFAGKILVISVLLRIS